MEGIRSWGFKPDDAMRGKGMLRLLPVCAVLGFAFLAVTAKAQFQQPTDEELKMTAEPKAPGAAAIYLYREEKVDDELHYHSFFGRIKVLTEKGKELATVEVPYRKGRFQINESLRASMPDGINAEFHHFLGLEDYHSELMAVAKLSGNLGTVTGKRFFLPGIFFSSRVNHAFVAEEKRVTPVEMEYADSEEDDVTYRLPEGFTIESAPPATKIPWPGHAVFSLNSTVAPASKDRIVVVRSMARAFTMVPPQEYPTLRDFYQKVAAADQQQLVLTMAQATAGGSE